MIGIQQPEMLLLSVLLIPMLVIMYRLNERYGKGVMAAHLLVGGVLVLALSSPYLVQETSVDESSSITVIDDRSPSSELMEKPSIEFDDIEVDRIEVASGNQSDIENGLIRNLEPGKNYLVLSDYQTDGHERVTEEFSSINASINFLQTDMDTDHSVRIRGPESTVIGAENSFMVEVHSTEEEIPEPVVHVNGETVNLEDLEEGSWSFDYSFNNEGDYTITSNINENGYYEENQEFNKVVNVRQKPQIATVGSEGSLEENLEEFYRIDNFDSAPEDVEDYLTLILKEEVVINDELREHVIEGNGLIQTGEISSTIDSILPVRESEEHDDSEGAQVVFAIDSSVIAADCPSNVCFNPSEELTEETTNQALAIAYSLIEELPMNNRVGAIAYQHEAYSIDEPRMLSTNRNFLLGEIEKIRPEGNALHHNGLKGAVEQLDTDEDEGNIIMITDANENPYNTHHNTFEKAETVSSETDAQVITVGVGENPNQDFLESVAEKGNGFYLDASQTNKLSFMFEAGGAADETVPLVAVNPSHYITENLDMTATATNFHGVEPRRGADLLVTGTNGNPYLTTWNYGLGRVAQFTAGDTELSELTTYDPDLLSRTVAWTVGDPDRNKDEWFEIESGREGDTIEARSSENIQDFRRQGENLYVKELNPETTGIHEINNRKYAYNYRESIEEIGYNNKMSEAASRTGGKVYTQDQMDEIQDNLIDDSSSQKVEERNDLSSHLIALGLIILLGEIGFRKRSGRK